MHEEEKEYNDCGQQETEQNNKTDTHTNFLN